MNKTSETEAINAMIFFLNGKTAGVAYIDGKNGCYLGKDCMTFKTHVKSESVPNN